MPSIRRQGLEAKGRGMTGPGATEWTRIRGVAPPGPLTERPLLGGVSSAIFAVEGSTGGVVVKRALAALNVDVEWRADPKRSLTEARALGVLRAVTPDRVPLVIDIDPQSATIVLELAPRDARNWRDVLLGGPANPVVGGLLGATVAAWHRATWMPWSGAPAFTDGESLETLRLQPFHATVAARLPDVATEVLRCADELRRARLCLVHGDASPKNVLTGPSCLWLIDPEVAHIGDPVLDVAFMGAHLILIALARPSLEGTIQATWQAFLETYLDEGPSSGIDERLGAHLGCILLARTDGVSREPGLDAAAVAQTRHVGRILVNGPKRRSVSIWEAVRGVLR
jgi:tRNA A-37 threonylcarbamoyl transferase component Bud32